MVLYHLFPMEHGLLAQFVGRLKQVIQLGNSPQARKIRWHGSVGRAHRSHRWGRWFESNCHHHPEKLEKSGFSFFLPSPGGTHFPYTKFGVGKVSVHLISQTFDVNEIAGRCKQGAGKWEKRHRSDAPCKLLIVRYTCNCCIRTDQEIHRKKFHRHVIKHGLFDQFPCFGID